MQPLKAAVDRKSAEEIVKALQGVGKLFDHVLVCVDGAASETEAERVRSAIARSMGLIYFEVLEPIFRQYRDLEPPEWKATYVPPEK